MKLCPLPLLVAMLLAALPSEALAGGFTITIIGGKRTGMMTNIANPDDLTALFHNPAGLADQPGVRLHLSTSVTFMQTEFDLMALDGDRFPQINEPGCGQGDGSPGCDWPIGKDGYYDREIKPEKYFGVLPYAGVSTDLGFLGPRGKDVVFSFALYSPDFYGAYLPEDAPTAYHIIQGFFMVIAATAGVGWKINKHVSVGGSLSYHYMRMNFAQKLSVIDLLTDPGATPSSDALTGQMLLHDIRLDFTGVDHGVGWDVGILVRPTRWLTLGFNYNGATAANFAGELELSPTNPDAAAGLLDKVMGFAGYKTPERLEIEMPIPHALMFGVNVDLTRWLTVGLDYRLWLYTLYTEQVLNPIYGDSVKESEKPMTKESLSREKEYGLSYEVTLGFMVKPFDDFWRVEDLGLMAGVAFDRSPIPGESFSLDNPSISQIAASVGVRAQLFDHWRLALTYLVLVYLPRDVQVSETSPPTNARGRGVAHIPGIEIEYVF